MNVGLYRAAISMASQERRLEAVAGNLANVATPGYKRTLAASREVESVRGRRAVRGLATRAKVDFSQGSIERTGRGLDLALYGDGFLAAEGPEGELYTRDGSLHQTAEGVLVTAEGYPVAWEDLRGAIDPTGLPVIVDAEGTVTQGAAEIGRLRVVDFLGRHRLTRTAGGYWAAPPGLTETAHTATVHQGALERSNAGGIESMVELIGVQRTFEQVAQVISAIDQSYRRLTR